MFESPELSDCWYYVLLNSRFKPVSGIISQNSVRKNRKSALLRLRLLLAELPPRSTPG